MFESVDSNRSSIPFAQILIDSCATVLCFGPILVRVVVGAQGRHDAVVPSLFSYAAADRAVRFVWIQFGVGLSSGRVWVVP